MEADVLEMDAGSTIRRAGLFANLAPIAEFSNARVHIPPNVTDSVPKRDDALILTATTFYILTRVLASVHKAKNAKNGIAKSFIQRVDQSNAHMRKTVVFSHVSVFIPLVITLVPMVLNLSGFRTTVYISLIEL